MELVLLGGPDNGAFSVALDTVLSRCYRVARKFPPDTSCDIFLTERSIYVPGSSGCILLCKENFSGDIAPEVCVPRAVGLLRSDHLAAAHALARHKIPAVTCGMAVTDTLTFSSLTGESAVVCLQRTIPILDGGCAEPAEAPLTLSQPYDAYVLMCAVAVTLLSGGWDALGALPL